MSNWAVPEFLEAAARELLEERSRVHVGGDLPVDQERGPLTGRLTGEFEDVAFHFFALKLSGRL